MPHARPAGMVKALVKVGYGCNDHCTFCHTLDVRHIDGEAAEVHAKIERAHQLGHDMVVLSGGEPTIRPELLSWARHTAELGMDFGLVTNGRVLSYPDLVDKLVASRLRYVYLSLHGGTAKVHNLMVRSDAFEQTYAAIGVLSGRGLDFHVNCVITRHNVDHLRGVVDAMRPYPDVGLKLSMVEPKGGGRELFDHLIPRVEHVADRVRDAIAYAGADLAVGHGGIPLCLLPGLESRFDDLRSHHFATMVEIGEPDFYPVDDHNKIQPEKCEGCSMRGACPGLYRAYHERFGDEELRPLARAPRSNSFNYTLEEVIEGPDDPACPLLTRGVTPWDRGRHLFVRSGRRLARFRATTRDFADVEIEDVKHRLGQIYLDVSSKPAPDDFSADLVQLSRSSVCNGCSHFEGCTGLFEPRLERVFTRDDARVRELLSGLSGRVLDVGCGDGPYADILERRVGSGELEYVGADPDGERIAALRARWPWARLHVMGAEELSAAGLGAFDHVLLLRSWNHLRDPAVALAAIRAVLRSGGTLTVVENVVFGLARTKKQTVRAERGPAGFEHYRNDDSGRANDIIQRAGFELLEARHVSPDTSNQWVLRYAAPGARYQLP